jgi:hypothetical protein
LPTKAANTVAEQSDRTLTRSQNFIPPEVGREIPLDKGIGANHFQEARGWELSMTLMRGRIVGYDVDRMAFKFMMLNKVETVECEISSVAMDDLAGKRGTLPAEREAQFMRLREVIERIASDKFDSDTIVRGAVVRIFAKHVRSTSHSLSGR